MNPQEMLHILGSAATGRPHRWSQRPTHPGACVSYVHKGTAVHAASKTPVPATAVPRWARTEARGMRLPTHPTIRRGPTAHDGD